MEAAEAGIELIVAVTEGIPMHDEATFYNRVKRDFPGSRILGPNCPGLLTPGECNIGFIPAEVARAGGPVGIVSRSGTLTYQALNELAGLGIGVTTCVGIGGDPVPGTSFIDCLELFEADPETKAVIMFGEIGGSAEEEAAAFIKSTHVEAGRELHRRRDRAARKEDGPRGRDHLGLARAPRRRRWPCSKTPACASRPTRPRPAS